MTPGTAPAASTDAAALRDATAIAARVAADEAAADAERTRLGREPLPELFGAPPELERFLHEDEVIHAERHAAILERGRGESPIGGTLLLTSERLVHFGRAGVEAIWLRSIIDMAVAMERVLLIELTDGSDLAVEVDQPRLLRVQVAAARARAREQDR